MILRLPRGRRLRLFAIGLLLSLTFLLYKWRAVSARPVTDVDINLDLTALDLTAGGFLEQSEAELICLRHGWRPYPKRDGRRKIYDMFLFNGEMDWLEIRLSEIARHVDYIVIVEAATTFTGITKPLALKDNTRLLRPFSDKIIYHVLEKPAHFPSRVTWDHEDLQRNALFDQVFPGLTGDQKPNLGDVLIVSDVDEIPRPSSLVVMRNCNYPRRLTLQTAFYYYGFQWRHRGSDWNHPQATYYEGDDTIRPANLRNGEGGNSMTRKLEKATLANAGWHCSSCFATLEEMVNKMWSFSHTKLNKPEFRDRMGIVRRVRSGLDLFDRPTEFYDRIENNDDIPEYMKRNVDRFGYLMNRDPANANFRDFDIEEAEAVRIAALVAKTIPNGRGDKTLVP